MTDLLTVIRKELANTQIQHQANLIQEKINSLLCQMTADTIPGTNKMVEKEELMNNLDSSPHQTNSPVERSPFAEAEGKPVAGVPLSYVNSLEQKKRTSPKTIVATYSSKWRPSTDCLINNP